jgi:hypothetical protein
VPNKHHPYHPIIYVRGFAATHDEIEETVADPYMGFNLGSTKTRQVWDGKLRKFFFESPLVRLKDEIVWLTVNGKMTQSDRRYDDVYVDGDDLTAPDVSDPTQPQRPDITLPYQSVVVFRYYDEASEAFGNGNTPPIEHFAKGLSDLILRLKVLVCRKTGKDPITDVPLDNDVAPEDFQVYLVAHSMGGLVCRAFLQNPALVSPEARSAVNKLFTYATPHNGIDLRIVRNVPGWASFGDANNFNRERMAGYFGLPVAVPPGNVDDVSVVTNFPPDRIFNLVGTNPSDYLVLSGLSAWAAGEASDGLVRIANATTHGPGPKGVDISSPRAFAHRSHSGHYGIVNSEEGYQNLTRFLFGSLRVDGILDIDKLTLPKEIENDASVRASYHFEIVATVRGRQWQLHRRTVRENSAIHRLYDDLFPPKNGRREPDRTQSPHLFSIFLDPTKSVKEDPLISERSVAFAFDLSVLVPDYQIDGVLWLKRHFEGGYLYRELILVEATPDENAPGGWAVSYGFQSKTPNKVTRKAETRLLPDKSGITFDIEVVQEKQPGIDATLRVEARTWN